jgi:hypothetical protein
VGPVADPLYEEILRDLRGDETMEWYTLGRIDGREDGTR